MWWRSVTSLVLRSQRRGRQQERHPREGRHLPVPVQPGVDEPHHHRRRRSRGQRRRAPVEACCGRAHASQEQGQEQRAHEPQLGQRLDVDRMRVHRGLGPVGSAPPLDGEAAGARARERVVGERRQRGVPVRVAQAVRRSEPRGADRPVRRVLRRALECRDAGRRGDHHHDEGHGHQPGPGGQAPGPVRRPVQLGAGVRKPMTPPTAAATISATSIAAP